VDSNSSGYRGDGENIMKMKSSHTLVNVQTFEYYNWDSTNSGPKLGVVAAPLASYLLRSSYLVLGPIFLHIHLFVTDISELTHM
jgi:hypothetical protein